MKHVLTSEILSQFVKKAQEETKKNSTLSKERIVKLVTEYYETILLLPGPREIVIKKSIDDAWRFIQENLSLSEDIRKSIEADRGPFDISRRSYSQYKKDEFAISVLNVPIDDDLKKKHSVVLELSRFLKLFSFEEVCVVGMYEDTGLEKDGDIYSEFNFKKLSRGEIATQISKDVYSRRFGNLHGYLITWLYKYDSDLFKCLLEGIQKPLEEIYSLPGNY